MSFNPQFEKIGDILVYEKVITQNDLEQALEEKKSSNEKLGQILINKKIISEVQLVKAYSQQMGHKHVLENDLLILSNEDVALLSEEFAREHHVIAMKKTDSGILIAMEDPEDLDAIDGVRKITGLNPEIVIAGRTGIDNAINNFKKANKLSSIDNMDLRFEIDIAVALIAKGDFTEASLVLYEILRSEDINYSDKNKAEELLALANFSKGN